MSLTQSDDQLATIHEDILTTSSGPHTKKPHGLSNKTSPNKFSLSQCSSAIPPSSHSTLLLVSDKDKDGIAHLADPPSMLPSDTLLLLLSSISRRLPSSRRCALRTQSRQSATPSADLQAAHHLHRPCVPTSPVALWVGQPVDIQSALARWAVRDISHMVLPAKHMLFRTSLKLCVPSSSRDKRLNSMASIRTTARRDTRQSPACKKRRAGR